MFERAITLPKTRSFFLFGARGTGKSTLIETELPKEAALWIDLLEPEMESRLARDPGVFAQMLENEKRAARPRKWVVIDEIQKLPGLLGTVHAQIRKGNFRFALTGSSARKLKRGGADMLAGRASWFELFPLTHLELSERFKLEDALHWGTLPEIFKLGSHDRIRYLRSYCNTYLKEEVIAEQLVRKIQPFRVFLELAALQNGQIINYAKFARDLGVDITTVQGYFEILKDTLIGIELPAFHLSVRKRQRQNPKFYLFDLGVVRALSGTLESKLVHRTQPYGKAFEHFFVLELYRLSRLAEKDWKFSYLLTKDGAEIDLIVEKSANRRIAIEIKSSHEINETEVRAFERLGADIPNADLILASNDPIARRVGAVKCLYWKDALSKLSAE